MRCPACGREQLLEWKAGDPPIYIDDCHGETMHQVTHNDGKTPLDQPCPSDCCPGGLAPPDKPLSPTPAKS